MNYEKKCVICGKSLDNTYLYLKTNDGFMCLDHYIARALINRLLHLDEILQRNMQDARSLLNYFERYGSELRGFFEVWIRSRIVDLFVEKISTRCLDLRARKEKIEISLNELFVGITDEFKRFLRKDITEFRSRLNVYLKGLLDRATKLGLMRKKIKRDIPGRMPDREFHVETIDTLAYEINERLIDSLLLCRELGIIFDISKVLLGALNLVTLALPMEKEQQRRFSPTKFLFRRDITLMSCAILRSLSPNDIKRFLIGVLYPPAEILNPAYMCTHCRKIFMDYKQLEDHISLEHKKIIDENDYLKVYVISLAHFITMDEYWYSDEKTRKAIVRAYAVGKILDIRPTHESVQLIVSADVIDTLYTAMYDYYNKYGFSYSF